MHDLYYNHSLFGFSTLLLSEIKQVEYRNKIHSENESLNVMEQSLFDDYELAPFYMLYFDERFIPKESLFGNTIEDKYKHVLLLKRMHDKTFIEILLAQLSSVSQYPFGGETPLATDIYLLTQSKHYSFDTTEIQERFADNPAFQEANKVVSYERITVS